MATTSQSVHLQDELRQAKDDLKTTVQEIKTLNARRRQLEEKVRSLNTQLDHLSKSGDAVTQFEQDTFEWSSKMAEVLRSTFKIDSFRSHQKASINATLSGQDCILIMPTGGGKSLCFQLPALLSDGVTLVVSPLISLMEDQLQAMKALGIPTYIFNSNTDKDETKLIFQSMIDPKAPMKLLYVTPEKLAKSKRLMSQLEKMYRLGRFSRLVIDEVHCCSQWGHDFRPDYKFLGIMKTQYPKTPIIGLTATATPNVIVDVQKILNIEGCLVFKDSFYRSNLVYEVSDCPSDGASKVEDIATMIKTRFSGESGIVYCLTIKDCEDVAEKLRTVGIKADRYHAQLEPPHRSKIQQKWYNGSLQVIVATVAFGMGINKLDVRFVIHHSLSKSVENYYQETGRAGRDGDPAYCILLYKFADVFRASSLMFTERNGVSNVYNMLKYCLDRTNCRKGLLAKHFGDQWDMEGCGEMCDTCQMKGSGGEQYEKIDAGPLLDDVDKILDQAAAMEERMTQLKLMDAWFGKGTKKLRVEGVKPPKYSRMACETVLALLLVDDFLKEDFHFTPYSTISYIVAGAKVVLRSNGKIPQEIWYSIPTSLMTGVEKPGSSSSINSKASARKDKLEPVPTVADVPSKSTKFVFKPRKSHDVSKSDSPPAKKHKTDSQKASKGTSEPEIVDLD